jgi:hypothetical protein
MTDLVGWLIAGFIVVVIAGPAVAFIVRDNRDGKAAWEAAFRRYTR